MTYRNCSRILGADPLGLLEQVDGLEEKVIEVERVALFQRVQVIRVNPRDVLVATVPTGGSRHLVGTFHAVLGMADSRERGPGLHEAVVDVQLFQRVLDDRELVRRVVDDEIAREPDGGRLAAQQTGAERVKRRHPHPGDVGAEQRLDPRPHLFRRLVGKRHREDFLRLSVTVADEICDAAGDDAGFAGPGAGKNQKRSLEYEGPLPVVQG